MRCAALFGAFLFFVLTASAMADAPDSADATAAKLLAIPAFRAKLEANKPVPTGDALFDRYAAEIWQRNAPRAYFGDGDAIQTAACLPDDVLAGWEQEFGKDPRYWQLRYFSAQALKASAEADAADVRKGQPAPAPYNGPDPVSFLQHAVDINAYDVATLKALFTETLKPQLAPDKPEGTYRPGLTALKPGGAELLLPIADKMVAEFPHESDSWYTRAIVHTTQDDETAALADLKHGNAAQSNRYVIIFPYSTVLDGMVKGQPAGSRYVSGMIRMVQDGEIDPGVFIDRKFGKQLLNETVETLDWARWQTVHDWGVRRALRKGEDRPVTTVILGYSSWLARQLVVKHPEKLTEDQRDRLVLYVARFSRNVMGDNDRISHEQPSFDDMFRGMLGDVLDKSGKISNMRQVQLILLRAFNSNQFQVEWFSRDFGWALCAYMYDTDAFENGKLRDQMIEHVQKFAKWDWTKLEYTQTPEELHQEKIYEDMAKRVQAGDLSMDQAVKELGKTKPDQQAAPAPVKPDSR